MVSPPVAPTSDLLERLGDEREGNGQVRESKRASMMSRRDCDRQSDDVPRLDSITSPGRDIVRKTAALRSWMRAARRHSGNSNETSVGHGSVVTTACSGGARGMMMTSKN
uniref:Uncharacterized protein n=2 Tax=Oryza sativa subsp. japonica TaxID=39947 RepID=Q6Z193_ORYSJ|nr:hypothetical protein [Oryza sativa Japonica Group]BAD03599.1 hypothetical protein [Oryza sativa Japonica Group]